MTKDEKLRMLKFRLHIIKERGKSSDSPGVMHKLERQIRNLEGQSLTILLFFKFDFSSNFWYNCFRKKKGENNESFIFEENKCR